MYFLSSNFEQILYIDVRIFKGEGFNAVIESVEAGLGAPDPQKLAEMDQMAFKMKSETSDSEEGLSIEKKFDFQVFLCSICRTGNFNISN